MNINTDLIGISGKKGVGKDLVASIIQYLDFLNNTSSGDMSSISYINFSHYIYAILCCHIEESEWKNVKFADKLKDIVCLLIGCTREQLEDREFKEKELGEEWWIKTITYIDGGKHTIINPTPSEELDLKSKYPISYNISTTKLTPRMLLQQIGTDLFRNQLHPNIWVNATMADYRPQKMSEYNPSKWIISDVRFPNEAEAIKDRGGIVIRINRPGFEDTGNHESETALDNYKGFDYIVDNNSTIDDLIEKIYNILINKEII